MNYIVDGIIIMILELVWNGLYLFYYELMMVLEVVRNVILELVGVMLYVVLYECIMECIVWSMYWYILGVNFYVCGGNFDMMELEVYTPNVVLENDTFGYIDDVIYEMCCWIEWLDYDIENRMEEVEEYIILGEMGGLYGIMHLV